MKRIIINFKAIFLFLFCLNYFSINLFSNDYTPMSQRFEKDIIDKSILPNTKYDSPNLDSIFRHEFYLDSLGINRPYKFGIKIPVKNLNKSNFYIDTLNNGILILRYKIIAIQAKSINIKFENYFLPDSCIISVYNNDKTILDGPWGNFNVKSLKSFSTFPTLGDTSIIEISLPKSKYDSLQFTISDVIYGFRESLIFQNTNSLYYGIGQSQCTRDANCSLGDEWCKEKNSVVFLQIEDESSCSGALVNNTNEDFKGYILTAFHCLDYDSDKILSNDDKNSVLNWSYKFMYYSTGCNSSTSLQTGSLNYAGSTYRASWWNTDFALIELNNFLNNVFDSTYGYYEYYQRMLHFSGWDMHPSISSVSQVVMLHHPLGDLMKISKTGDLPNSIGYGPHPGQSSIGGFLRTRWYCSLSNSIKCIGDDGSSGAPMYNQDHRIIAQYAGGQSSCDGPNNYDYGGRIGLSWLGGGTRESSLHEWLDPINAIDDRYITSFSNATGLHGLDGATLPYVYYGHILNNGTTTYKKAQTHMKVGSSFANTFVARSGSNLTLQAGKEIRIRPCTRIQSGSEFRAFIQEVYCDEELDMGDYEYQYANICTTPYPKISSEEIQPEIIFNSNFTLSPNPVNESIRVSYQISGSGRLYLRNSLGVDLLPFILLENSTGIENIDISKFPIGIYFISIESDSGINTEKFVVSR